MPRVNALGIFFIMLFFMQVVDFFFFSTSKKAKEEERDRQQAVLWQNPVIEENHFRGVYRIELFAPLDTGEDKDSGGAGGKEEKKSGGAAKGSSRKTGGQIEGKGGTASDTGTINSDTSEKQSVKGRLLLDAPENSREVNTMGNSLENSRDIEDSIDDDASIFSAGKRKLIEVGTKLTIPFLLGRILRSGNSNSDNVNNKYESKFLIRTSDTDTGESDKTDITIQNDDISSATGASSTKNKISDRPIHGMHIISQSKDNSKRATAGTASNTNRNIDSNPSSFVSIGSSNTPRGTVEKSNTTSTAFSTAINNYDPYNYNSQDSESRSLLNFFGLRNSKDSSSTSSSREMETSPAKGLDDHIWGTPIDDIKVKKYIGYYQKAKEVSYIQGSIHIDIQYYRHPQATSGVAAKIRLGFTGDSNVNEQSKPRNHLLILEGPVSDVKIIKGENGEPKLSGPRFGCTSSTVPCYRGRTNPSFHLFDQHHQSSGLFSLISNLLKGHGSNAKGEGSDSGGANSKGAGQVTQGPGLFASKVKHCSVGLRVFNNTKDPPIGPYTEGKLEADDGYVYRSFLDSPDCRARAKLLFRRVHEDETKTKVWNYAFLLNLLTIGEMWYFAHELSTEGGNVNLGRIFLASTFGNVAMFQIIYLGLYTMVDNFIQLIFSSRDLPANVELFNTFSIVIFLKFVLFASMQISYCLELVRVILNRLLTRLHRLRRTPLADPLADDQALQNEIRNLYWRFYTYLLGAICVVYIGLDNHFHWLLLFGQFMWLPQIATDVIHGFRQSLSLKFCFGVSFVRIIPVLYMYGCPVNIYNGDVFPELSANHNNLPGSIGKDNDGASINTVTQQVDWKSFTDDSVSNGRFNGIPKGFLLPRSTVNYTVCLLAILIHALQLGIMYRQRTKSSRWFVPWILMPNVYCYSKAPPSDAYLADTIGNTGDDENLNSANSSGNLNSGDLKDPSAASGASTGQPSNAGSKNSGAGLINPIGIQGIEMEEMEETSGSPDTVAEMKRQQAACNAHGGAKVLTRYDCVICMSPLDWKTKEDGEKPACAPCNHWFHRACLEQWMVIKMECPTCRNTLPPLEE